jgi:hypothetical protein
VGGLVSFWTIGHLSKQADHNLCGGGFAGELPDCEVGPGFLDIFQKAGAYRLGGVGLDSGGRPRGARADTLPFTK